MRIVSLPESQARGAEAAGVVGAVTGFASSLRRRLCCGQVAGFRGGRADASFTFYRLSCLRRNTAVAGVVPFFALQTLLNGAAKLPLADSAAEAGPDFAL